jgi:hypothetical protein
VYAGGLLTITYSGADVAMRLVFDPRAAGGRWTLDEARAFATQLRPAGARLTSETSTADLETRAYASDLGQHSEELRVDAASGEALTLTLTLTAPATP